MTLDEQASRTGLLHAFAAYAIWGLAPAYFKLIVHVPLLEILGERIVFSFLLLLLLLVVRGQLPGMLAILRNRRVLGALAISGLLIGGNWLIYIGAVASDHILAASLGYFLNPLVNVLLGVTVLRERLDRIQMLAIGIAAAGVAILAAGAPDTLWISLSLAVSFALYGLVRKLTPVPALTGLAVETMLLLLPAMALLFWVSSGAEMRFGADAGTTGLLIALAAITTAPLVLFASGARRLPMVTLGLMQYIAPILMFLLGVFVYGEQLTPARWASFALVCTGLALFAGHSALQHRRAHAARGASAISRP